ncbi:trigger factor [Bacteriovoracaceae bacterium]|nr:trigger factor [Bacteriovoracaceae bacterium]
MNYKVEEVNGCTKKLVFSCQDVDLSTEIEKALKSKQKTVNLKGFRKGKAPLSVVEKMYGEQAKQDAIGSYVAKEFYKAIEEEKIEPLGYPRFANTDFKDSTITFEATIEIYPEIEIKDYSSLAFSKDDDNVSADEVEKYRESLISSRATIEEVKDKEAKIENGQFAIFNFEGEKEDGEKPENMKAEEYNLELGSRQFIPGFEEQMIGMKAGEKKDLKITFPEDYHEEALKNAAVTFHVELLEIKQRVFPELTDELCKEIGFETIENFNTKTEKILKNQKKRNSLRKLHEDILNKLVEDNAFDIPTALVAQQRQFVEQEMGQNLKAQGFSDAMVEEYKGKWQEDLNTKANYQVKTGLILNKLSKDFAIEVTEEDINNKYTEVAQENDMKLDEVKEIYGKNETSLKNLRYAISEEKTFEKIKESLSIN